jgi:hypothetical protein
MVERSLSMREAPGSMPGFSTFFFPIAIFAESKRLLSLFHFLLFYYLKLSSVTVMINNHSWKIYSVSRAINLSKMTEAEIFLSC